MPSVYVYDPYIHTQSSALSVWDIKHNFGRSVNVAIYDENESQIYAHIEESSLNAVSIRFRERGELYAQSGKAVIS